MFAPHAVPARDTLFRKRRVNRTSRPSEFPHSQIRGRSYITRPCVALREAGRRCLCHIPLTAPRLLQMRGQTSDRDPGTGEHSLIKSYLSHFALYEPRGLSSDSPARRAGTFQDGAEDGRRGGREPRRLAGDDPTPPKSWFRGSSPRSPGLHSPRVRPLRPPGVAGTSELAMTAAARPTSDRGGDAPPGSRVRWHGPPSHRGQPSSSARSPSPPSSVRPSARNVLAPVATSA